MLSKTVMLLTRYSRRLWVRVTVISLLSLLAALLAPLLGPLLPQELIERLDRNAVMPVLTILASGMLAVTTFSLNVMVSAYRSASGQATPRAYRVLLEDTTTQTVLATFVGAFIFSLTAIILFRARIYDAAASVIVFGFTVLVVVLIIAVILRWIDHLSSLGSMDHTLNLVEDRARTAIQARSSAPCLGGSCLDDVQTLPPGGAPVPAPDSGYVQFIDMKALDALVRAQGIRLYITVHPGKFVLRGQPVAFATAENDALLREMAGEFTISPSRSFEQDPRFGLIVLSEISSRALSPGINDPGTAIEALGRMERLLWDIAPPDEDTRPRYPDIFVPRITAHNLIGDAFNATARDGAGMIEVVLRLVKALDRLGSHPDPEIASASARMLAHVRDRAHDALQMEADRDLV